MPRIIAAIDNSAASGPVLDMALAIAPLFGAGVGAVHVGEDGARTARAVAERVNVPFEALPGDPLTRIAALAARHDTVAVAIGARRTPGGRRPAGHLALAVADRTDKPVIVVAPEAHPPTRVRRVLVGLEGTPSKTRRLSRAIELVDTEVEVVVLHVDDYGSIPPFTNHGGHETEAYAREFLARHCPGVPVDRLELRIGDPVEEILAVSEAVGADLVALGWPQGREPAGGVVARSVLSRSHMPLLLVATTDVRPNPMKEVQHGREIHH